MTGHPGSALLAVVERSPEAAAAHDRAGWVGLFTTDGRIEDPVGSRPHVGHGEIGRFYDTFIGPRDIAFRRDLDVVRGPAVVRDLDLEVVMGSAVTMTIPAFLRYDLREVDGEWKIAMLRAYWELPSMMLQFLRNGVSAVPVTVQLSQGLIRNQRLRGTAGFAAGFRRVGSRCKELVNTFVDAVGRADKLAAQRTLSPDATMTFGDDNAADIADLVARCPGAGATKLIAAGSTVAVSITSRQGRGVIFADVARRRNEIRRIRYFPASSTSDAADSPK
ncbi:MAG TPA: ketosteroid isomerase family protein [Mycobacterium sp.]|uniref:ketosteroid isomerase family protein n=1 Tax=Mycobacterium sp. TaxID=1785 RepID=UPI002B6C015E|nr:ketosteroid isomerase family protein [Mycobacterium sp.]HME74677.1 ketosteroid isomerase family protein [Mycobacterium sp.]